MIYTMDIRVFTLLSCALIAISNGLNVGNITEYLDEALRNSEIKIAKSYLDKMSDSPKYIPKWRKLLSKETELRDHNEPLAVFNKIFTLLWGEEIISINVKVNPQQSNIYNTISIYRNSLLRYTRPVKLIRNIIWDNSLYLLICYEDNICSLYTSENGFTLLHRQDFWSEGLPVDAKFLIKDNRLLLAIANNIRPYPAASVIYLWTENYMIAIAKVSMTSVVSVTMFKDKKGVIVIIFGRSESHQADMTSEIYELSTPDENGPGSIKRIQFLHTSTISSLHHHVYYGLDFLLVIYETDAARLFWWHRKEFRDWGQTKEIYGRDIVMRNIFINDNLYIFVAQRNTLSLFERKSESMNHLGVIKSDNGVKMIDFYVWKDAAGNIFIVSIIEQLNNSYGVESWQLLLNPPRRMQNTNDETPINERGDSTMDICLSKLRNQLKDRIKLIDKVRKTRKSLGSFNASPSTSSPMSYQQMTTPLEASTNFIKNLIEEVDELLTKSRDLIQYKANSTARRIVIPSSVVIDGDARFKSLKTPSIRVRYINDVAIDSVMSKKQFSDGSQHFSEPLRGRHVSIHNLQVNSLCGIPKEHWLLKNDTLRSPLKPINRSINPSLIQISGDTVKIQTDVNFHNIHTTTLNSINLPNVFDNLFIAGREQIINGNLCYHRILTINNLTLSGHLNGIDKNDLMTLTTNQNFTIPIKIDFLHVHHLVVNKINGIPIEDAARVSRENVIYGKVIVQNLKVHDEFLVKNASVFTNPKRQIHMFDDVEIVGNLMVDRLLVEPQAEIILGNNKKTKGEDVKNLFLNSWTKSTDQIISIPIVQFQRGLTIDQLNTKYLNGLQEHEYLYTTIDHFPKQFGKIHFKNLYVTGSLQRDGKKERLFDISGNSVTINRRVHIPYLTVHQLYVNRYNGMSIDMIMSDKISDDQFIPIIFPNDTKLFELIINERLEVDSLQYGTLNNRRMSENLNNTNSEKNSSREIDSLNDLRSSYEKYLNAPELDVTIDGELIVEDELIINVSVDGQDVNEFLDHLAKSDIHITNELSIDNLTIYNDSSIEFLHDVQFNEFLSSILLKSKDQEFPYVSKNFGHITTTNLDAKKINGFTPDQLRYINDTMIFENDVKFTRLFGDIDANSLNGLSIGTDLSSEFSKRIQSLTRLNRLSVNGRVTWKEDTTSKSLSTLFRNAVTRDTEQTITAPTKFSSNNSNLYVVTFISSVPLYPSITEIIEDSVIDIPNSTIWISARKNFLDSVIIADLDVDDDIAIPNLNSMTIKELNDSLIRKFANETIIEDDCVLIGQGINISHLISPDFGPNFPTISALFFFTDNTTNILPTNIYFEELNVRGNATVDYFDEINFNEFIKERVTTTGNHVVYSKVQFTEPVQVMGETRVKHINDIPVEDFIINGTVGEQILGTGAEVFFDNFAVDGDTDVISINGMDISRIFEDGIVNTESVVIESDLIFVSDVDISSKLTVSQSINDRNLSEIVKSWDAIADKFLEALDDNHTEISNRVKEGMRLISDVHSSQLFSHLEFDENFSFPHVHNVSRIVPVIMDNYIKFDIYSTQIGKLCTELPADCPCRMKYNAEITKISSETIRVENEQWIVYNFREPNGSFEIKVKTNTLSSSPRCRLSRDRIYSEHTIISFASLDPKVDSFDFDYPIKIYGYLHDVRIFARDNSVYIVLAMGYDAIHETHETNSFIYKLNLETYELILKLTVSIHAASVIEVFGINNKDSYVFIGSALDESLLFKLDPTFDDFFLVRSFPMNSGTARHVKNLHYASDHFLFIDNGQSNEIQVYCYDKIYDNFYIYQSLVTESPVTLIETFNIGGSGRHDVFMVTATESGDFFLYEYMIYEKFKLKMKKQMGELLAVAPFCFFDHQYLLLISPDSTTSLRIVVHG